MHALAFGAKDNEHCSASSLSSTSSIFEPALFESSKMSPPSSEIAAGVCNSAGVSSRMVTWKVMWRLQGVSGAYKYMERVFFLIGTLVSLVGYGVLSVSCQLGRRGEEQSNGSN